MQIIYKKIIKIHSRKILSQYNNTCAEEILRVTNLQNIMKCNCRKPEDCPLQNRCLTNSLLYLCTISSTDNPSIKKAYIGSMKNTFETRWYRHNISFHNSF